MITSEQFIAHIDSEGGNAFPCTVDFNDVEHTFSGMTMRSYFAGQALAGLCARGVDHGIAGALAAKYADATLAELAKEKTV